MIDFIKKGDYLLAFTGGDAGDGDGVYQLSVINQRLASFGQKPVELSAICVDQKLGAIDNW